MAETGRWSAAKCQRIQDKLEANVGGASTDPEHLLDVLVAAWEEMHREASDFQGAVEALHEYGVHKADCRHRRSVERDLSPRLPCTCGWTATIERVGGR